jgi:hypothetical protein
MLASCLIFAAQNRLMDHQYHEEYQEELEKVQDRDFTHSWVSSSGFIFYLSVVCMTAFAFGSCYNLYNKRFEKTRVQDVRVQESTLYTPKYSTPK